jgi:ubiquinone/menaquinone biosynthesis C-methylase UbiE
MRTALMRRILVSFPPVVTTSVRDSERTRRSEMVAQADTTAATALQFNDETARRIEAMYLHPDMIERRRRVRQALVLAPGERVIDIGCGPGFLMTEVAADVGPTGWACGLDLSESMLALARDRCAGQPGAAWVDFRQGDAVTLPFPDASFDAAVATQVYEYVADVPRALAELHRVLRPGGRAVIVDTDWDSIVWHSTDPGRTARILAAWDEHLADPYLPRTLRPLLRQAGFVAEKPEAITTINIEFAGYSRGAADLVAAFIPGRRGIAQEDAVAWLEDLRRLDEEGSYFFSLDQYLFLATTPQR